MTGKLEFNLPEEQSEFDMAVHAVDYYCVVSAIEEHLRSCLKHGHQYKNIDEALEDVRERLHDETRERHIEL